MTDIKLSQLNSATSISSSDLLPVSIDLGAGSWESKSITAGTLLNSLTATRSLKVAKDGIRDADTIKDAVALAVTLSPTQTNPVVIQVLPGAYTEDNPISIPQWVTIYSEGGYYGASVTASNNGNIFVGNGNSELNGFTIFGQAAFSNVAYTSTSTTSGTIKNCIIINCHTGVLSNGGSIVAIFITGLSMQRVFDKFLSSTNSGFLSASTCVILEVMTSPIYAYYASDIDSELYLFSCSATGCINGLYVNNNAYADVFSNHYEDCENAIHVGPDGSSESKIMGSILEESITNDIYVESSSAVIAYNGHLDSSKFNIVNGANVNILADDENVGGGLVTGSASLQGKVSIGTPGALTLGEDIQLNVGEGSAFVDDKQGNPIVEYWSYDASAPSGTRFTRFANNAGTQLTSSNDEVIVGCKYPYPSIRIDVDVAANVGSSTFDVEYWDGITWIPVDVAVYRRSDFARRQDNPFQNVETQFVEFGSALFDNGDWADDNDVLDQIPSWDAGDSFYAIRFRNNGALTSGMQFANGKVKPHSFMISTSGKKANFGLYRTDKVMYIDSIAFTPDPTNPPSYVNLNMSPHISFSHVPVFKKANAISQVSVAFIIPSDIDTASPLKCYVNGNAINNSAGDIFTTMYVARIDSTNPPQQLPLDISEEIEASQITSIVNPSLTYSFVTVYQEIDVSKYGENDLLLISFARFASDPADSYSGDVLFGDITLKYKSKFV